MGTEPSQSDWKSTHSTWSLVARRLRVPLGFAFAILYVWLARPTGTSLLIGGLLLVPGLMLRALASGHVQKDKQLTITGPYAYTRNPLYLGSLILAAGFAVAARNWWIVGTMVVIFGLIYIPVIAGEESFLRHTFPEYDDYARHVPRMLPRFTRYRDQKATYSSERYWKHREYQAALGCAALLVILVIKLVW